MSNLELFAAAVQQDAIDTEAARVAYLRLRARDYVAAMILEDSPSIIEAVDAAYIEPFRMYIPSELARQGRYLQQVPGGWAVKVMGS